MKSSAQCHIHPFQQRSFINLGCEKFWRAKVSLPSERNKDDLSSLGVFEMERVPQLTHQREKL